MTDIIERLRSQYRDTKQMLPNELCHEAADEIAGLKTYAATIAAERDDWARRWHELAEENRENANKLADAANELAEAGIKLLNRSVSNMEASVAFALSDAIAERDALAKELAEAKSDLAAVHAEYKLCRELLTARATELSSLKAQSEPVAYADSFDLAKTDNNMNFFVTHADKWQDGMRFSVPLYTRPAPADKDAERYRWLRDGGEDSGFGVAKFNYGSDEYPNLADVDWFDGAYADAAIDAAMIAAIVKEGKKP